jgi:hypothetical protein
VTHAKTAIISPEIERVERLFAGDESTSVGTLLTQEVNHNSKKGAEHKHATLPAQNSSVHARSVSTTLTSEEAEKKMNIMSSDIASLKAMIQEMMKQQQQAKIDKGSALTGQLMEVEENKNADTAGGLGNNPTCHG